ncbi:hypothetical protein [Pseudoduganella violaceinigra]|nr:hypothetical protein [Pseudoduganella violaceinigra]
MYAPQRDQLRLTVKPFIEWNSVDAAPAAGTLRDEQAMIVLSHHRDVVDV